MISFEEKIIILFQNTKPLHNTSHPTKSKMTFYMYVVNSSQMTWTRLNWGSSNLVLMSNQLRIANSRMSFYIHLGPLCWIDERCDCMR